MVVITGLKYRNYFTFIYSLIYLYLNTQKKFTFMNFKIVIIFVILYFNIKIFKGKVYLLAVLVMFAFLHSLIICS